MIRFSPQQEAFIRNQRMAFNRQQGELSRVSGTDVLQGNSAIGNADIIPRESWEDWDADTVETQRSILAVYTDLSSLARPINIGKIVSYFKQVSDSGEVVVSMDGVARARRDRPTEAYQGTPIPIYNSVFGWSWRDQMAANTTGESLDPTARDNANRVVATRLEASVLDGEANIDVGGSKSYGLRTHPKRNTRSTGETLNGATGAQWVAELTAGQRLLHADNFRIAPTLYLNWDDWFYAQNTDYASGYNSGSIAKRVREMGFANIVPASQIAADEFFMVWKNRQTMSLLTAMPMVTVPITRRDIHDNYDFDVWAAGALQIKYDSEDQCAIAHSS